MYCFFVEFSFIFEALQVQKLLFFTCEAWVQISFWSSGVEEKETERRNATIS